MRKTDMDNGQYSMSNDYRQLEVNIISAQDLKEANHLVRLSGKMQTYAVAWINPCKKLSTQIDRSGASNPTWNDKVIFRVEDTFLRSEASALMIEIYCIGYVKDVLVGTVRVLVSTLVKGYGSKGFSGMNFSALQVRRASGRPQGILNVGTMVFEGDMHNMSINGASAMGYRDLMGNSIQKTFCRTRSTWPFKDINRALIKLQNNRPNVLSAAESCKCSNTTGKGKDVEENCSEANALNGPESTETIESRSSDHKASVGCDYPILFDFRLRRSKKGAYAGLRSGPAKIHLSPSDKNMQQASRINNPTVDAS
eukprot:Gb_08577 [translate_table: standard]